MSVAKCFSEVFFSRVI